MLKKASKISKLGVFSNYNWDNKLEDFKKYNIFYGWNYSGKTSLSRAFSCFERGCQHPDYPNSCIHVETDEGSTHISGVGPFPFTIRVYNEDFVKDNIQWNEDMNPILILGEENIELQKEHAQLFKDIDTLKEDNAKIQSEKSKKTDNIDKSLTNKAREIKRDLSIPDFDRPKFESYVINAKEEQVLSEPDYKNIHAQYISPERKKTIANIPAQYIDLNAVNMNTTSILNKNIHSHVIEKLKNDPQLNSWVRKGKDIHTGKTHCEFCGALLPEGLMNRLNEHFSDEYDKYIAELTNYKLSMEQSLISTEIPEVDSLCDNMQISFSEKKNGIIKYIKSHNDYINTVMNKLDEKINNPFSKVEIEECPDTSSLISSIDEVNSIIDNHNDQVRDFEKERAKQKNLLLLHYAAEFAKENSYFPAQNEIQELSDTIVEIEAAIKTKTSRCLDIEKELTDHDRGADKINQYLNSFFGKRDLVVKSNAEHKFEILRDTKQAMNLSHGEKTAISFAYFMTKLYEQGANISDDIVFIDDPISSLDSNHIFSTYAFIKRELHDCKQLFICTHNFEFLNLIKDWLKNKPMNKTTSYYVIEKNDNNISSINNMPRILVDFNSEYHYLFSLLRNFSIHPTHENMYLQPNIARRFLEAYLGIKVPISKGIEKKLDKLDSTIADAEKTRIVKFCNEYSHNTSLPRSLNYPDLSECTSVVNLIINLVKTTDQKHYDSLVEEITTS